MEADSDIQPFYIPFGVGINFQLGVQVDPINNDSFLVSIIFDLI